MLGNCRRMLLSELVCLRQRAKKQLLGIAKAIIFEEGLQRFTMEALALTAGVTPPLIYNYFSGRQALLKSLLV